MTILVDMDDTIENLLEPWLSFLNTKHGTSVKPEDVKQWDMRVSFPELTEDEIYEPLGTRDFWKTVHPKNGAVDALKSFTEAGHNVFVVTNSHYSTVPYKMEEVLFRYFPFLSWENVIICDKKQMIYADVLIDDNISNLEGGRFVRILMDMPHNRDIDAKLYGALRVKSWEDIVNIVNQIESKPVYSGVSNNKCKK